MAIRETIEYITDSDYDLCLCASLLTLFKRKAMLFDADDMGREWDAVNTAVDALKALRKISEEKQYGKD